MYHKPDYAEAIKSVESLHGNMAVLSRLNEILRDYNSNLADAERLILSDGALAATVIKISNSVLYGRGKIHTNVHAAIQQVGFSQVLKLVGLALSKQVFMKDLKAYGVTADQYWFSSYFTALFLEQQVKSLNYPANDAYLIGLLHDIGKVVINELLIDREVEVFWDPSIPSESWEMVMVGFTYNKVGSLLLENWKFPTRIYEAIGRQTSPAAQENEMVLCMLDFCRHLVSRNTYHMPLSAWRINYTHPYLVKNQISAESVQTQIQDVLKAISQVRQTLASI